MRLTTSSLSWFLLIALLSTLSACALDPGSGDPVDDAGLAASIDAGSPDTEAERVVAGAQPGRCRVAGWLDEACDEERGCQGALRCVRGFCALESRDGEPCDTSGDCVSGSYCRRHDDDGRELADPRCAVEIERDGDCVRLDVPCASGLRCIAGQCRPRSAAGGPCAVQADCGDDLACHHDAAGGPSCQPERGFGEPCDGEARCGDRLRCLDGLCAPRGRSGDRCAVQSDCQPDFFCDRFHGDRTERITPICKPEVRLWGLCDPREASSCLTPGHCLWGQCLDDLAENEACEQSSNCLDWLYCADPE